MKNKFIPYLFFPFSGGDSGEVHVYVHACTHVCVCVCVCVNYQTTVISQNRLSVSLSGLVWHYIYIVNYNNINDYFIFKSNKLAPGSKRSCKAKQLSHASNCTAIYLPSVITTALQQSFLQHSISSTKMSRSYFTRLTKIYVCIHTSQK